MTILWKVWAEPRSILNQLPLAWLAAVSQNVERRPSLALDAAALLVDEGTAQAVRSSGAHPPKETVSVLAGAVPPTQFAAVLKVPVPPPHTTVAPFAGRA